ncbi:hypothetical protein FQN60_016868, partial [Etheostoma spectabile]
RRRRVSLSPEGSAKFTAGGRDWLREDDGAPFFVFTNMSQKSVVYKKICKDNSMSDLFSPLDGVIIIDPEALQRRKVFVTLSCTFRYGRDDMDVMGIAFRRELYLSTRQVYPPLQDLEKGIHTSMQAKLLHKLGNNAYPFFFEFPDNLPCSVALQPGAGDVGKQCAVEFEIKAFSAESQDAKVRKRSTVKLLIRKVQYAPERTGVKPSIYYHGETLKVKVTVTNNSSKPIKNIIVSVDQIANVVLYCNDSYYSVCIPEVECVSVSSCLRDSVSPGATLQKVYKLLPLLANNVERRGIALDGKLKHEDTNLASSSIEMEGDLEFQEFRRSGLKGVIDDEDEDGNVSAGDDMEPKEK